MKVILVKDVPKLGKSGQVVEVADGYGRNFLIPRGLAIPASEGNLRQLEERSAAERRRAERELAEARRVAERIDGRAVAIRARAGEQGRLFGSVTAQHVAEALARQHGVTVDRRRIELPEPIRHVGAHRVTVRLHRQVTATVTVHIQPEEG